MKPTHSGVTTSNIFYLSVSPITPSIRKDHKSHTTGKFFSPLLLKQGQKNIDFQKKMKQYITFLIVTELKLVVLGPNHVTSGAQKRVMHKDLACMARIFEIFSQRRSYTLELLLIYISEYIFKKLKLIINSLFKKYYKQFPNIYIIIIMIIII